MNRATTTPAGDTARLAVALRELAAGVRGDGGLEDLLGGLEKAFGQIPGFQQTRLEPLVSPATFEVERLSLPLVGTSGPLGLMRVEAVEGEGYSRQRLHLAAAVADVVSIVLERVLHARSNAASQDLLVAVLHDLATGVVCYDARGVLVMANPAAQSFLGGRAPARWADFWPEQAPESRRKPGQGFLARRGPHFIQVTASRPDAHGPSAIVLTDMAGQVSAFRAHLEAETWRSLVQRRPLTLVAVMGPEGSPEPLHLLESVRGQLPAGSRFGLVDLQVAAVVVPEAEAIEAWRTVRRAVPAGVSVHIGAERLRIEGDTPDGLLARAVASVRPAGGRRPEVLVFDASPAVTDAVSLILRGECSVATSNACDRTFELLEARPFDGIMIELPSQPDELRQAWAREVVGRQPAACPFYLSEISGPWGLEDLGLPVAPVFRKPFSVREMRSAVMHALAAG